jgi:tetratricopeptide (TPR) repeat protein
VTVNFLDSQLRIAGLGTALLRQGKRDEAIAEYREAIRLQPDLVAARNNLGSALIGANQWAEAIAEYREVIRLEAGNAEAHNNLGTVLAEQRKWAEAIAEFREAIRLQPDRSVSHSNLGSALSHQGKLDEAILECREAIRLQPDNPSAHASLGAILCDDVHDYAAAVAEFMEAIRLEPGDAGVQYSLGNALKGQGKLEEAIVAYRESIRLRPDEAEPHCNLGHALGEQGRFTEALRELERGHALGSKRPGWPYPSAQWVRGCEQLVALEAKLPALLRGEVQPADSGEAVMLAMMGSQKQLPGAAARFWSQAFQAEPKLADDINLKHRYNAACAAALAGAGQGKDEPPLDEAAKAGWRRRAIDWLKADLRAFDRLLQQGPAQAQAGLGQTLRWWKNDPDLAGLRDQASLAKLSDDERKACRVLWSEVDALLAKAPRSPTP